MVINRNKYLNQLIEKQGNSLVKVITGLRRSGKSFLLFNLFVDYLKKQHIASEQIITFAFDNIEDIMKLDAFNPEEESIIKSKDSKQSKINEKKFVMYIQSLTKSNEEKYYILLDEIQELNNFVMVLNGLLRHKNFDIYVTGSNSKMLSKDIVTEFRGRGDQLYIQPLSFKEFFESSNLSFEEAYLEYQVYGGLPFVLQLEKKDDKKQYLHNLFEEIYIKDIIEKNNIQNEDSFRTLLNYLSSNIGSYTNPRNIENTFISKENVHYYHDTIKKHINYMIDSFILTEANKYDIKGKRYIGANSKFYFTDLGLRNALINFRQLEPTHIMENIIYNELIYRGYSVDVGIVEVNEINNNGSYVRKQLETDFVCNQLNKKIYIQSVYSMETTEKRIIEQRPFLKIKDNFRKIIIVNDFVESYYTEEGIEVISLKDFLLDDKIF